MISARLARSRRRGGGAERGRNTHAASCRASGRGPGGRCRSACGDVRGARSVQFDHHQSGLRRRRQLRRNLQERLHRALQPEQRVCQPHGMVGAVRRVDRHDVAGDERGRFTRARCALPRAGAGRGRRHHCTADTERHRQHRHGGGRGQGGARLGADRARRYVPDWGRRPCGLRSCELLRGRGGGPGAVKHDGCSARCCRRHRHR